MPSSNRKAAGIISLSLLAAWLVSAQVVLQKRTSDSKARKNFNKKGIDITLGNLQIEERNIHYAKTGNDNNPTLLFIHGSPGSWDVYESYLSDTLLLEKFRMIAVDRPGFGYSEFGNTMNASEQGKILSAFAKRVYNNRSIVVIGHSYGAPMALRVALSCPSEVKAVVLMGGSVDPSLEKKQPWRPVVGFPPFRWLIPTSFRYSNDEMNSLRPELQAQEKELPGLKCFINIFHGDKDKISPVKNVDYLQRTATSAEKKVTIIPGAKHFILWDHYSLIRDSLLKLAVDF